VRFSAFQVAKVSSSDATSVNRRPASGPEMGAGDLLPVAAGLLVAHQEF